MSRTIDSPSGFESFADDPTPAQQVQAQLRGKTICPFCGTLSESTEGPCPKCTMENTPLTRQATRARLGPWYVLQSRNPAAPGMKYSVLLSLVKKGQVTPRSIVRGPTTNQFWRFAAKVRGLSREFGICWGCGQDIAKTAEICPHCQRSQLAGANADQLLDTRQPISQILPVRREIRPAFPGELPTRQEAAMQETMRPARHSRPQLAAAPQEPSLEEIARQEMAQMQQIHGGGSLRPARGGLPPAMLGPQSPGAFPARPMPASAGEPRQSLAKALLMLVLMGIFTVAGWLYVDVHSRERFFTWVKTYWAQWIDQPAAPTLPPPATDPDNPLAELTGKKILANPSRSDTSATESQPLPPVVDLQRTIDAIKQTPTPPPTEQKAEPQPPTTVVQTPQPPQTTGQAEVRIQPPVRQPEPVRPQPPAPPAAQAGIAEVEVVPDPGEALRASRRLWREALDADARGDYATAVKIYEQIQALPPEVWPGGLQVNLKLARDRAGQ